MYDIWIS